jgi:CelD/BcsL family acetyltransferase involved in cellulose biosynthesis
VGAWERLHGRVPTATGFQTYAWQRGVFETLCKAGRLRLLAVWRGEELAGVFAMSIRDDGLLETMGPAVSDYLEPLIDPAVEREVWGVMLKVIAKLRAGKNKKVTLHNVREGESLRTVLPELVRGEGFGVEEKRIESTPVLALPRSWEEYLGTLDAHERKETRRKLNKAITKGGARVVKCSADPAEISRALADAFVLMEQAPGDKGEAIRKTIRPLLERAAPGMIAAGRLWLHTLYLEEKAAAVTIQFPYRDGPQLYNCGFDAAKKEWSPGVVLTSLIIKEAIEGGAREFDLLRGQEPYKYRLGAKDRGLWMVTLRKL